MHPTQVPDPGEVTHLPVPSRDGAAPTVPTVPGCSARVLGAEVGPLLPTAFPTRRAQGVPTCSARMNCPPVRCLASAPPAQHHANIGLSVLLGGRAVPVGQLGRVCTTPLHSGDASIWLTRTPSLLSQFLTVFSSLSSSNLL